MISLHKLLDIPGLCPILIVRVPCHIFYKQLVKPLWTAFLSKSDQKGHSNNENVLVKF